MVYTITMADGAARVRFSGPLQTLYNCSGEPGFQTQFNNICFYLGFPARHNHGSQYGLGGRVERVGQQQGMGTRGQAVRKHTENGSGLSQVLGPVYSLSPSLQAEVRTFTDTPKALTI